MYNIAICDDNELDLQRIKDYVVSSTEYEDDMQIWSYTSAFELLDEIEKRHMDLLILDMQMPRINGFEAAEEIRKYDMKTVIAFCSSECVPRPEHFRVQPYRYLMKGESKESIEDSVKELLVKMKSVAMVKGIKVTTDGKALVLKPEELLYLEKQKYGTDIMLTSDSILYQEKNYLHVRERLNEIEKDLEEEGFARPSMSYLVNLKRVKAVDGMEVIMENGERISITRKMREQFHHEFSKYFMKKYRRGS